MKFQCPMCIFQCCTFSGGSRRRGGPSTHTISARMVKSMKQKERRLQQRLLRAGVPNDMVHRGWSSKQIQAFRVSSLKRPGLENSKSTSPNAHYNPHYQWHVLNFIERSNAPANRITASLLAAFDMYIRENVVESQNVVYKRAPGRTAVRTYALKGDAAFHLLFKNTIAAHKPAFFHITTDESPKKGRRYQNTFVSVFWWCKPGSTVEQPIYCQPNDVPSDSPDMLLKWQVLMPLSYVYTKFGWELYDRMQFAMNSVGLDVSLLRVFATDAGSECMDAYAFLNAKHPNNTILSAVCLAHVLHNAERAATKKEMLHVQQFIHELIAFVAEYSNFIFKGFAVCLCTVSSVCLCTVSS